MTKSEHQLAGNKQSEVLLDWIPQSTEQLGKLLSKRSTPPDCSLLPDAIELQRKHRGIKTMFEKREIDLSTYCKWQVEIWEKIVISACENLFTNHPLESAQNSNTKEELEYRAEMTLTESEKRNRASHWLLVSREREGSRVALAVLCCKRNKIAIPPDWLRDLDFFSRYHNENKRNVSEEKISTYFENWLKYKLVELRSQHNGRTRDRVGSLVGLTDSGVQKQKKKTEEHLKSLIATDYKPNWPDYLAWDIDLSP